MMNYRSLFFSILVLFVFVFDVAAQEKQVALKPVLFSVKPAQGYIFRLTNPCYPFTGNKNSIVRIAPALAELSGARSSDNTNTVQLKFASPVNVLIALPQGQQLSNAQLVIDSALTITGLPPYAVYKVAYKKGWQTVNYQSKDGFIAGVIGANQQLSNQSAHQPDGRLWRPYITDGFTDGHKLFEILGGPDQPVIDEGMPGTEGIQGGFEGGTCVKVGNTYHMFPTERAGEAGVEAYYDRVKTRIGHWESPDAIHWKRVGTIYQASGKYAIAEEDNPMNDRTKSKTKGMEGIGGPYDEGQLIMEPGLDAQPWEGRQGVASFYPYPVKDGWLGFYAGAYPFKTWADYPGNTGTGWFIGLAKSASMDGPWKRLDTTVNPITSINPGFVENPLVYKLQNGAYITMFDGGPDGGAHHFPNMIGYTLSKDGVHWSEARYLPLHTKVKRWWSTMRTPLCLIPEGDNVYTIVYAAYNQPNKRFHPMGMVKVKMDPAVLSALLKE